MNRIETRTNFPTTNYNWAKVDQPDHRAHTWHNNAPYCSCGQDTVTCQGCGKLVCGELAVWKDITPHTGNVGPCCFAKFGIGHQGK